MDTLYMYIQLYMHMTPSPVWQDQGWCTSSGCDEGEQRASVVAGRSQHSEGTPVHRWAGEAAGRQGWADRNGECGTGTVEKRTWFQKDDSIIIKLCVLLVLRCMLHVAKRLGLRNGTYTYIYICVCVCVYACTCTLLWLKINSGILYEHSIFTFKERHLHTHTLYMYTYTHVHVHVHVCTGQYKHLRGGHTLHLHMQKIKSSVTSSVLYRHLKPRVSILHPTKDRVEINHSPGWRHWTSRCCQCSSAPLACPSPSSCHEDWAGPQTRWSWACPFGPYWHGCQQCWLLELWSVKHKSLVN